MAVGVVAIWWLVAHNSGAGWVQFVGDLVFGALLVGVAWPGVVVGRARIEVVRAPADGVSGLPLEVLLVASSRVRVRPLDPGGDETFVGPVRRGDRGGLLRVVPPRRGVYENLMVEVASAAPFALQWWSRQVTLSLPRALHVAPRRGRPEPGRPRERDREQDGAVVVRPRNHADLPRGARPYVPGDARHHIHWRATAHAGTLMVRELERPSDLPVTVVVDLPADPDEAERAAGRALGTVVELLHGGASVLLQTREPSGTVTSPVTDRRQAGRRLARAVSQGDSTFSGRPAAT